MKPVTQQLIIMAAQTAANDYSKGTRKNPYKKNSPMGIAYDKVFEVVDGKLNKEETEFIKAK